MSNHTIEDLRNIMFRVLHDLQDREKPLEVDRAIAIKDVAQTIINSAKVEVEHMRVSGTSGTGFLCLPAEVEVDRRDPASPARSVSVATKNGVKTIEHRPDGSTVTTHRLR